MNISVSEAKAKLTELVRLAEAGEEVVLTRNGRPVARLGPVPDVLSGLEFDDLVSELQAIAATIVPPSNLSASNHDYLYDENGLPA